MEAFDGNKVVNPFSDAVWSVLTKLSAMVNKNCDLEDEAVLLAAAAGLGQVVLRACVRHPEWAGGMLPMLTNDRDDFFDDLADELAAGDTSALFGTEEPTS